MLFLLIQKNHFEYSNGDCGAKKIKNNKYLKVTFIFFLPCLQNSILDYAVS